MSFEPPAAWKDRPSPPISLEERRWFGLGLGLWVVGAFVPGQALETLSLYSFVMWMIRDLQRHNHRGATGGEILLIFLFANVVLPGWALFRYRLAGAFALAGLVAVAGLGWFTRWDPVAGSP